MVRKPLIIVMVRSSPSVPGHSHAHILHRYLALMIDKAELVLRLRLSLVLVLLVHGRPRKQGVLHMVGVGLRSESIRPALMRTL